MKRLYGIGCLIILLVLSFWKQGMAGPGDTTVVRTFRFSSTMRSGVFSFPTDTAKTYEKILMHYSMRCKNGLISNQTNPNQGCGEWDYNCYTYLVDSTQIDSLIQHRNSHDISNFSGQDFYYTTQPVYTYTQYHQQAVTYTQVISETTAALGNGTYQLDHPLGASHPVSRTQYLWQANQLSLSGLNPGEITGLRLNLLNSGCELGGLRIRMKATNASLLDQEHPELSGWTEVFFLTTIPPAPGPCQFNFYQPYLWDGVSNLLMEFSYTNPSSCFDLMVEGHDAGASLSLVNTRSDSYLLFNGGVQKMTLNPSVFPMITDKITIAFWNYGDPDILPANTTLLEGVDSGNLRQVNIHLPWSNGRIYWDCGNDGSGYDRIDEAAPDSAFEGRWNFWAFTKDAGSGIMKIYLNGHVFASGTGKTKPIDIKKWLVGMEANGNLKYYGYLDELSIWNNALDSAAINQIMQNAITPAHPFYTSLLAYYPMDEGSGDTAFDAGPSAWHSELSNPNWRTTRGVDLWRNFTTSTFRPNLTLLQGVYDTVLQIIPVMDSILNPMTSVIAYQVVQNNFSVIDTLLCWQAGYTYVYLPDGTILDSLPAAIEDSIHVTQLTLYISRPMRIELINFITPYGKGLDLNGLTGKTWVYDVTDYARVLRGPRFMAMSDGIYQEDNDITFVFYEGTPPRNVLSLQQIWPSGTWVSPSYNDIVNNSYFEPRQVTLSPDASQFKIRTAISGHGQEGEFISRTHTISLHDTIKFSAPVWKECATNPVYPQGGTWIYDRAGWCPGDVVDTREYEITPYVTPGQTVTIDYSLPFVTNPGASNYRINNQLVAYGPPNFTLDAAVAYIRNPSKRTEFARLNPICNQPVIAIRNTGSTPLTSLNITYGRDGGQMSSYSWTGNLEFLETEEVTLPRPDWSSSQSERFRVSLSQPNGGNDQYPLNDTMTSTFANAAQYPPKLCFVLKTNNRGWETAYTLKDADGNVLIDRQNLANNTIYRDTLDLGEECYTVKLTDAADDGLSFWANPGQGSGYFQIIDIVSYILLKTFNPDFGDNAYQQFYINPALSIEEKKVSSIGDFKVYPNPASDVLTAEFSLPPGSTATIILTNPMGQELLRTTVRVGQKPEIAMLDISKLEAGVYFVTLDAGGGRKVVKMMKND